MYRLSFRIHFIKLTRKKQRTVETGIEGAILFVCSAFHLYLAQHPVPGILAFSHQRIEIIGTQFAQIRFRLFGTDKRRGDPCMHHFPFTGLEADNGSCVKSILLHDVSL